MNVESLCDCRTTPHLAWCITHKVDRLLAECYLHAASLCDTYQHSIPDTDNERLELMYTGQHSAVNAIRNKILKFAK